MENEKTKKLKLTKTVVETLPYADKGKQVDYYDLELNGFGIRVSHTGKKYFVRRLIGSKRSRVTIGSHPIKTAEIARSEARVLLGSMESGIDPNKQKKELARLEEEEKRLITIQTLVSDYIELHAKRFKRTWQLDELLLNKEIVPVWGKRKAIEITKRDVLQQLECILERPSPGTANKLFQIIRKMFNFAVGRDILPFSPCNGLKLPAANNSRDRVLSDSEIRTFWNNLPVCAISDELRNALKLVLITAQRPGEVIRIHTDEINDGWWTIPAERSKNGKAHRVPLTGLALDIIKQSTERIKTERELPADKEYSGFVFPCPHLNKIESIDRHALSVSTARNLKWPLIDGKGKPVLDKDGKKVTENRFGIAHFTPHDLRRTAATFMAQSGEMDEVIDAVLNHVKTGIIKVYNQYRYDKEKQSALVSWDQKLRFIISDNTVND
jgi:integrase